MLLSLLLAAVLTAEAASDYLATDDDLRLFEKAIAGALTAAPQTFPGSDMRAVDAVLLDSKFVYVYSRRANYPYPRVAEWDGYQVYRFAHGGTPREHELWGCRAGGPSVLKAEDKRVLAERVVRCAPWGTFRAQQLRRRSNYATEDGYLATMIHEFGHAYEYMHWTAPTAEMVEIRRRVAARALPDGVDRESASSEGFAQYCELKGAKTLYPAQYARLMAAAERAKGGDAHDVGLKVAADLLSGR